jgi:hypothetical protein
MLTAKPGFNSVQVLLAVVLLYFLLSLKTGFSRKWKDKVAVKRVSIMF